MSQYINLVKLNEVPREGNLSVKKGGLDILVCRVGEEVYAVMNECSHAFSSLEGGKMKSHFLFCPLHGVRFNLKNGCPSGKLTKKTIRTFPVKIKKDMIRVLIEES